MSIMKFIWKNDNQILQVSIDPDTYDREEIQSYVDDFLRSYLDLTGKSKDVDVEEYNSEDDQEEYQRIIEKWKAKDPMTQYAQNYVSSTAFDNRFHPELYGTSDPLFGAVPGTLGGYGVQGQTGSQGAYGSRPVEPPPKVIHIDDLAKNKIEEPFSVKINTDGLPGMSQEDINEVMGVKSDISLEQLNETIIPFLESLKAEPDKAMMHWPERAQVIDDQINKIKEILGDQYAS